LKVIRVQWPVGQGCFATGMIEAAGGAIHYVYDCGARSVSNLEPIVAAYARRVPRIDALFVSHLDGDHVDGLDTLLARLDATTVYLPYLSASQRLLALAKAEAEDRRLTASFVQAQFDPAGWFGSRGVERVVFVGNGDDSDLLDRDGEPSPKAGPREGLREGSGLTLKEQSRILPIADGQPGRAALLEMQIDSHIAVTSGWATVDWILRPYVPRVSDARAEQFEKKVLVALGRAPGDAIDAAALQALLKTPEGRRKLRQCYDAILTDGGGEKHNAVSMSLYSGPASDSNSWEVETRSEGGVTRVYGNWTTAGWIGTGDAKLKSGKSRQKWRSYYRAELARTMTLLLPHHGSKANFHADLLRYPLHIYIASADERDEGYRHPSAEVVEVIDDAGYLLAHVTKRLDSRFRETVKLIGPKTGAGKQP